MRECTKQEQLLLIELIIADIAKGKLPNGDG